MLESAEAFLLEFPIWVQIPLVLFAAVLAAKLLEAVTAVLLHRMPQLSKTGSDKIIISEAHLPIYISILMGGVFISAQLLPEDVTVELELLPGLGTRPFLIAAGVSVLVLLWARAFIRIGKRIITATSDSPSDRDISPIFSNILTFFIILATFFVLLGVWNVDVTPLLASAGILGIVIGIAAQDSLGNFFGGLSLHFDRTYQLGDMIEVESGERGTVIDISIRSTTILTRDNVAITIPNARMNSTQVINESAPVRRRRIRLNVGVAYGSDLETVERAILAAADAETVVLDEPKPAVRFREFADSAIVAQLQCYINHPAQLGQARDELIRRIDEEFAAEGVKIPFPQRELTFFEAGNEISVVDGRSERPGGIDPADESTETTRRKKR